MKRKELAKLVEPDPRGPSVERTYAPSEDGRKVVVTFKSDTPMRAIDLIEALIDFANDLVTMTYENKKN